MRTNDAGIAVPSESSPLPWKLWPHTYPSGINDANGRFIESSPETLRFQHVAANYHERMADIVRRLATVENWPDRMMVAGSALAIAEDAAALWAEYQKEVQS
jgi:hypothetical protein